MWGIGYQPAPVKALLSAGEAAAFTTHDASTGAPSHTRSWGYAFQELGVCLPENRACDFLVADHPPGGSAGRLSFLKLLLARGFAPPPAAAEPAQSDAIFKPDYEQESSL
jgi:hypothetical protein